MNWQVALFSGSKYVPVCSYILELVLVWLSYEAGSCGYNVSSGKRWVYRGIFMLVVTG